MKILKFGGTSVGTPQRMKDVCQLITDGERKIVVLSAMSGTTNSLVEIADYIKKKNLEGAGSVINKLRTLYRTHVSELYSKQENVEHTDNLLNDIFMHLHDLTTKPYSTALEKEILAQGELMSTNMVTNYLKECGIKVMLIPALDYMRTDANSEPDMSFIKENLCHILEKNSGYDLYITQGFICRNINGEIDNLQRGGSDYTACLIGAVLHADEIQIWTDIDGMHNNDPRFVEGTTPVRQLNFEEAAELAYFGAKILHPTCIQPAHYAGVPVRLLNTMDPSAPGTIINDQMQKGTIKAVAAKDNITAIKIVSSRMLLATGFLHKLFETFEVNHTPVDMVTTSEVGVTLTIDNNAHLANIVEELKQYGTVSIDENMCIICVVGDLRWGNVGFETLVTEALANIPVRMISYGGSNHNISFLIREQDKKAALCALSEKLFKDKNTAKK
ncbi:aspartate kinase [Prevotellamassilia timonensis]|uniref:aspartate kinase n=1 Tax=Prevotellamassilia timonensis TaxID=1852370 RepID=UPI003077A5AF